MPWWITEYFELREVSMVDVRIAPTVKYRPKEKRGRDVSDMDSIGVCEWPSIGVWGAARGTDSA
jgi:hypothetical protein